MCSHAPCGLCKCCAFPKYFDSAAFCWRLVVFALWLLWMWLIVSSALTCRWWPQERTAEDTTTSSPTWWEQATTQHNSKKNKWCNLVQHSKHTSQTNKISVDKLKPFWVVKDLFFFYCQFAVLFALRVFQTWAWTGFFLVGPTSQDSRSSTQTALSSSSSSSAGNAWMKENFQKPKTLRWRSVKHSCWWCTWWCKDYLSTVELLKLELSNFQEKISKSSMFMKSVFIITITAVKEKRMCCYDIVVWSR